MDVITIFLSSSAAIAMILGIAVFANNHTRKTNQAFLIATTCLFLWLFSNVLILHSHTPATARIEINMAFAIAACLPSAFTLLRVTIKYPDSKWAQLLKECGTFIVINVFISSSCFLPNFTKAVTFPPVEKGASLATPEYGFPYVVFNLYFLTAIVLFARSFYKDRKILSGIQRIELEFLGFACFAGLVVGLSCGTIFALLIQTSAPVPIAHSISVLTLVVIVAYGISVHRILAVAVILRKITAYSLLSCSVVAVYLVSWVSIAYILDNLMINHSLPAHIASTLIVVFSITPIKKQMEQAAGKLIAIQSADIPTVVKTAGEIFQSVNTYSALLTQFSDLLSRSFYTHKISILIRENKTLLLAYDLKDTCLNMRLSKSDALSLLIDKTRAPVCRDSLIRLRQTDLLRGAMQQLEKLETSIAVGIFSKSELTGMVLLGPKKNGRIYDKTEQDALQILCNQFAVALENAQLYTEVQDSKIRNEIMLDQLVSGVIVADTERRITLFNHEAQRITGIDEMEAKGKEIDILPDSISKALDHSLETQKGERNIDADLFEQEEQRDSLSVRMGTAYLRGHDEKPMGALLVVTDMTELKGLEEQVRRSDQLSSVGTLAAGMAHEIKNPLVTIKTFSQLLPQRYEDEDFRNDFSSLVAHEVERIDSIVNELLSFSKPTKPHLVAMSLTDTLEQLFKLTHEQMVQKNIVLKKNLWTENDKILGDAKLLSHALINLILNAIEAIGEKGTITVGTINCTYRFACGERPGGATTKRCLRLQISDTGQGIARENLQKIFDPFFTSKSEGTGMGLSVAHGIIQEHNGVIEVESEVGRKTTFYIYIPTLEEEAA